MKARWIVGGVVLILGAGLAMAAMVLLDEERLRAEFESGLSEALGMDVSIPGRVSLGIRPTLNITGKHALVESRGYPIAELDVLRMHLKIPPLLRGNISPRHFDIDGAHVRIERLDTGRFNFQSPDEDRQQEEDRVPSARFRNSSLSYLDLVSGTEIHAEACTLRLPSQRPETEGPDSRLARMQGPIDLECQAVRGGDFVIDALVLQAHTEEGRITLDPVRMRMYGGEGSARLEAEFTGATPFWHLDMDLEEFELRAFIQTLAAEAPAEGTMNFSAKLWAAGAGWESIGPSLEGTATLRGAVLKLYGEDLDALFEDLEATQEFSLVDLGALLFAGPAGVLVTKGIEYASLLGESGGTTAFREVVARWQIEDGVAHAKDVAAATARNRIAARGRIDFMEQRFDDFTFALLDREGCAVVEQTIGGPLDDPEIEQPGAIEAVLGPVIDLFESGVEKLTGDDCDVFYAGVIGPSDAPEDDQ